MFVLVDCNLGNLRNVQKAFEKIGEEAIISNNINDIEKADGLILPGVGSARQGMENLKNRKIDKILVNEIKKGKPFLGICLGMQLLFSESKEGNSKCLNVIEGTVKEFNSEVKVPQIGWNMVEQKTESELFKNIPKNSSFYFTQPRI